MRTIPIATCNGANLYCETRGHGRPLVFLHGAWAGLRSFGSHPSDLSRAFRTIALDFRGHGRSEKTPAGHTVPSYARDVQVLVRQLDLTDVVLVGWSLGALVAWEYVRQFGTSRLGAIVNIDMEAAPGIPTGGEGEPTYDLDQLRRLHEAIQTDHLEVVDRSIDRLFKHSPSDELRRAVLDEDAYCPPLVKSAIILDASFRDYRDVLPDLDIPMLVCAGADETWRRVSVVRHAARLAPDARFELFEESGHCPMLEEPDRFQRLLAAFAG